MRKALILDAGLMDDWRIKNILQKSGGYAVFYDYMIMLAYAAEKGSADGVLTKHDMPMHVDDVAELLGRNIKNTMEQLDRMEDCGLIKTARNGRNIYKISLALWRGLAFATTIEKGEHGE